jgi:hypothetical protein
MTIQESQNGRRISANQIRFGHVGKLVNGDSRGGHYRGDYEPASNKFTGPIESVTIVLSPSKLAAADRKAIDDVGAAANKADD